MIHRHLYTSDSEWKATLERIRPYESLPFGERAEKLREEVREKEGRLLSILDFLRLSLFEVRFEVKSISGR